MYRKKAWYVFFGTILGFGRLLGGGSLKMYSPGIREYYYIKTVITITYEIISSLNSHNSLMS